MSDSSANNIEQHLVILVPGLNGGGLELGQLPQFLTEQGKAIRVLEIDGYTFGKNATKWTYWLQQFHRILDEEKVKYASISIVGISMGSTLALAVATQRDDISSLVLLSPVLKYDGWSVPWYYPMLRIFYLLGFRRWRYFEREPFGVKNPDLRRRIAERFKSSDLSEVGAISITAHHLYQAICLKNYTKNNLFEVTTSTLIVQSVEDDTCSVWSAEKILEEISSELRRIIWLGNSYHIVTVDNERETVLNEVSRFLNTNLDQDNILSNYYMTTKTKPLRLRT